MVTGELSAMSNSFALSPEDLAQRFVQVKKYNYLAHTIREIELEVHRVVGWGYHIVTRASTGLNDGSRIFFHKGGSIIFLPAASEEMDDREIRLVLAHELGHIIYNLDKLGAIRGVRSPTEDEELFAWRFAFYLIKEKSLAYGRDIDVGRYIHDVGDLKRVLERMVKKKQPSLHEAIKRFLKGQ